MRKLALLTTLAIAAMAMTATTAFGAVAVTDPSTGNPCTAVSPAINAGNANVLSTSYSYSSGGCAVSLASAAGSPVKIRYGTYSHQTVLCDATMSARIGPDGWGYVTSVTLRQPGTANPCAGTPCPGSRVIAPPEYNPDMLGGFTKTFPFANANTELNVGLCAAFSGAGNRWGLMSMDVVPVGGNAIWTSQQNGSYLSSLPYWQFEQASFGATAPGGHPVITHL